jgi:L-lactate dehydrogenase complex protein LldE
MYPRVGPVARNVSCSVKNPDVSAAICADKVTAVRQSGAEVLCAADNSCLMHIGGALRRQRSGVRTMHLAEILAATEDAADDAAGDAAGDATGARR